MVHPARTAASQKRRYHRSTLSGPYTRCQGTYTPRPRSDASNRRVDYIVDTLGEMGSLFAIADVVFMGGSLLPIGGHNPLEPAQFGLPVICGPHLAKNQAEFDGFGRLAVSLILPMVMSLQMP